jgi:ABC-2 type transport system permease protein
VSLLVFWLLLTIVCPALVNNYLLTKYPVPEALHTLIEQREGYHEKWDMDKKITMDKFYAHYPQFTKYALPDKEFSWLWYYAMQQMGDDEAQAHALEMQNKLWLREKVSNTIGAFVPTLHAQLQLNRLAETGLSNHLQFLESTTHFHEKMRLYFYPKIFEEMPVKNENWRNYQAEYFKEKVPVNRVFTLLPLLLWILLLLLIGSVNLARNTLA